MDFVGSVAGHAHFPEGDFHIAGSLKKRLKLLTTCHVCLEFLRTILINGEEQESVAHSVGSGCLVFFQQPLAAEPEVDPMDGRAVKVVPTWRGKELEVKTRPQNSTDSKFIKPGDSKFTKSKRVGTSVRNAKGLTVYPNVPKVDFFWVPLFWIGSI